MKQGQRIGLFIAASFIVLQSLSVAQEDEWVPSDGSLYEAFGYSVSIDGQYAVIGAPWDDTPVAASGSAYLYDVVTRQMVWKVLNPSPGVDNFGYAVDVCGDRLAVGTANGTNTVYVFEISSQTLLHTIEGSDVVSGDKFGINLAMSSKHLAVCAEDHTSFPGSGLDQQGAVYVFDLESGQEMYKLTVPEINEFGHFGSSVDVSDTMLLVGAKDRGQGGMVHVGASYLFDVSTGVRLESYSPESPHSYMYFGGSVALDSSKVIVGASRAYSGTLLGLNYYSGACYIYDVLDGSRIEISPGVDFEGFVYQSEINFGFGVSSSEGLLAVAAPNLSLGSNQLNNIGGVFLYSTFSGNYVGTLTASGAFSNDELCDTTSRAIAVDGGLVLAGAFRSDPNGEDSGSAYLFSSGDCNVDGVPDWTELSGQASLDLNYNWVPDECDPDCDGDGLPDFLALLYGVSQDCNDNAIPDECDLLSGASQDCDLNSVPDECETDCNGNGIDDACDFADGTSLDCNSNGIPDECDIASGSSIDANSDGQPDECKPDCNGNGVPDYLDINFGLSQDCDLNGIPDECELDCNGNGLADQCDLNNGTSQDCDGNSVPDECDPDCDGDGIPDSCDPAETDCNSNGVEDQCELWEDDCNSNGLLDECELADGGCFVDCNYSGTLDECELCDGGGSLGCCDDCNNNGIPDPCEISEGLGEDCNSNDVLDECDLANFTSPDCNSNDVPDECDLADGTSPDCNGNAIPDECDIAAGEEDCESDGIPDICEMFENPNLDLNTNGLLDECECFFSNYCTGEVNTTGQGGKISFSGSAFVSFNDLTLVGTDLPTNQFGVFYYGPNQLNGGAGIPFGEGVRCVGGTTVRLPVVNTGPSGLPARNIDNTEQPHSQNIQAGTTWNFQFWYRDPSGGPVGFNLTDALSITFCP